MQNERKLFQKSGITLIALVISIIVMLILAGVSLNAVIGDNGIITQAQNATYMQSVAVLEEYLNNFYVEHYEYFEKTDNKAEALEQYSKSSNWIWNPSKYGYGAIGYIVNEDGDACYLINKQALPEEIKNELKGGDAGEGTYTDYVSMNDVYGVTGNLQVYYCSAGKDSILGINAEELDKDNPLREIFSADSDFAKLINGEDSNEVVTAEDIKKVKELEIDNSTLDLSQLYNFTSLQKLSLKNINKENLNGIENAVGLKYLYLENCVFSDYSAIGKIGERLNYLYLYNTTDEECEKLCSKEYGIGNYDLSNLNYFGIMGTNYFVTSEGAIAKDEISNSKCNNLITNTEFLKSLSNITKGAVKYLLLNNNNIESLSGLDGFVNLYLLRAENNKLKDLKGIENANNLTYLYLNNNLLGINEIYDTNLENNGKLESRDALTTIADKSKLYYLNLTGNVELKFIEYIYNLNNLRYLRLAGNTKLVNVVSIKNISVNCGANFEIDKKYSLDLLDRNTLILDLSGYTLTYSNLESISQCSKLYKLSLENIKISDDSGNIITDENTINSKLNDTLSKLTSMTNLKLKGISALKTIDFVGNGKETKLLELDLRGTKVTDLTNLNNYAKSINTIVLDNEGIDLTKIQDTLNRCYVEVYSRGGRYWINGSGGGVVLLKESLVKQLENCTNLTRWATLHTFYTYNGDLDLSKTKLENIGVLNGRNFAGKIRLPETVRYMQLLSSNGNIEFEGNPKIESLRLQGCSLENSKLWNSLKTANSLKNIEMAGSFQGLSSLNVFSIFKDSNIKIEYLTLYGWDRYESDRINVNISGISNLNYLKELYIYSTNLSDISELSKINSLEKLDLHNNKISDISPLENLTNLKYLKLNQNSVSNLYYLRNMNKLEELDLSSNAIYDTANFVEEGSTITINNLQILSELNKSGNLNKLNLSNNNGIIDYSPINKLDWEERVGF